MKTILVLEDDPGNMQAFSALLWSTGYRVWEATTGEEALVVGNHHEGPIDLLLSDVAVPGPSGTVVALELIKSYPAMGILFVSGTPIHAWGRNDLENFRQLPSDRADFLEKPFRPSALLDKVDEMIRRCGQRSAPVIDLKGLTSLSVKVSESHVIRKAWKRSALTMLRKESRWLRQRLMNPLN